MLDGISITPKVYAAFDVDQWRDALYDDTGESDMLGITERQANLLYTIQKNIVVDRRLTITLARHMAGTDHGNGTSISSEMLRARLLTEALLGPERTKTHREMLEKKRFHGKDSTPESPRALSRFGLALLYAMLNGKDEALPELDNIDLEETGLNQHSGFASLLIDYVDSEEALPFEWWLTLNGLRDNLLY